MALQTKKKFNDDWLVEALLYYQIIEQGLFDELSRRFAEDDYFFDILTGNGYLEKEDIAVFIEKALKIPTIDLDKVQVDGELIKKFPEDFCRRHLLIPFKSVDKHIHVACFNTSNLEAEGEIEQLTGKYVKTYFAYKEQINLKISEYFTPDKFIDSYMDGKTRSVNLRIEGDEAAQDSSVVRLVSQILFDAAEGGASDIHIEPKEQKVLVRYRIDGVLRNVVELPRTAHQTLISRIKIISSLNIAETRKPQDGKAKIYIDDADIDLRVSVLPTTFGEKVVIRLLDKRKAMVSFAKMGIRGHNQKLLEECFGFKQGMILVTGPTGSGKSTTLYAAINRIRSTANNILTIEDPIEYMIEGINQVQVNEKAGVTFASALRSFLRQDPDVILVGEIRDRETAEIAIQAALTGHLVLSTLHTNDTFATITRLMDMGINVVKITDSIQSIVAQRLVRKLCPHCKVSVQADQIDPKLSKMLNSLGHQPQTFEAKGCPKCDYSGYKGRIGVYEILIIDNELKQLIGGQTNLQEIRSHARKAGFRNLFEDALSLVADGITDYKEVLRNMHSTVDDGEETAGVSSARIVPEASQPNLPEADQIIPANETEEPHPLTGLPAGDSPVPEAEFRPDVLIVDDFNVARTMIRTILEKTTNMTVREASDGISALEEITRKIPDVILLDIMMPRMDGYEFLQHLRAAPETANVPVLMLTSMKSSQNELRGLELGADDYLTKPIQRDILVARIRRMLDRSARRTSVATELKEETGQKPDQTGEKVDFRLL